MSLFTGQNYHTILREYGFTNLDAVTHKDKFYAYLNSSHGSNWKKLYKVFFDSDNAPSSESDLRNNKEKYAIQKVS